MSDIAAPWDDDELVELILEELNRTRPWAITREQIKAVLAIAEREKARCLK